MIQLEWGTKRKENIVHGVGLWDDVELGRGEWRINVGRKAGEDAEVSFQVSVGVSDGLSPLPTTNSTLNHVTVSQTLSRQHDLVTIFKVYKLSISHLRIPDKRSIKNPQPIQRYA
jgi:hypothetical protein